MAAMTELIMTCYQQRLHAAHTLLCILCVVQTGKNLAQWLVNKPDKVEKKLTDYSEEFLDFWKGQRELYWQQVAHAKKVFDEQQKNSEEVSSLLLTTHCEVMLMQESTSVM
jgi:hypothetical protein